MPAIDIPLLWDFLYNSGIVLWLCFFGVGILLGLLVNFIFIASNNTRF